MTLSIIIVSYNCWSHLAECLRSIYETGRGIDFEIIVVDNASSDGTVDSISKIFPDIHVIAMKDNVGFGRGCNAGAEMACGKYLLLLNPDTVLLPGALQTILKAAEEHPDARIWGGQEVDSEGNILLGTCWRFPSVWSTFCMAIGLASAFPRTDIFNGEAYGGWDRDGIKYVDCVSGCFLLIEVDIWSALGGFNPIYFMYAEELDLCRRARELGATPLSIPDAKIRHDVGGTFKKRSDRMIMMFKGKRTYMHQYWSKISVSASGYIMQGWVLSRLAVFWLDSILHHKSTSLGEYEAWGTAWRQREEWLPGYHSVS